MSFGQVSPYSGRQMLRLASCFMQRPDAGMVLATSKVASQPEATISGGDGCGGVAGGEGGEGGVEGGGGEGGGGPKTSATVIGVGAIVGALTPATETPPNSAPSEPADMDVTALRLDSMAVESIAYASDNYSDLIVDTSPTRTLAHQHQRPRPQWTTPPPIVHTGRHLAAIVE